MPMRCWRTFMTLAGDCVTAVQTATGMSIATSVPSRAMTPHRTASVVSSHGVPHLAHQQSVKQSAGRGQRQRPEAEERLVCCLPALARDPDCCAGD